MSVYSQKTVEPFDLFLFQVWRHFVTRYTFFLTPTIFRPCIKYDCIITLNAIFWLIRAHISVSTFHHKLYSLTLVSLRLSLAKNSGLLSNYMLCRLVIFPSAINITTFSVHYSYGFCVEYRFFNGLKDKVVSRRTKNNICIHLSFYIINNFTKR